MFIKNLFFMSSPEILNIFFKFAIGFVTAKLLGPSNMGIAGACGLIMAYAPLLQLGASDGAGLKIYGLLSDSSNKPIIQNYYNTAYTFVNGILLLGTIVLLIILALFKHLAPIIWFGISANLIAAFLYQYFNFSEGFARFDYNFKAVGKINHFNYAFKFLLTVVLTYYYGLHGLFLSLILSGLTSSCVVKIIIRAPIKLHLNYSYLKEMLFIGMPLIMIGSLYTLGLSLIAIKSFLF